MWRYVALLGLLVGCSAGRHPLTGEGVPVVFDRIGAPDAQAILDDGRRVLMYDEEGGWLSGPCRRTLVVEESVVTSDHRHCR